MSLQVEAVAELGAFTLDLELTAARGQCLALVGPSGAGKSSTLRVIAGLLKPTRGRVVCGEERWFDSLASVNLPPELRRCGYVFQDYALFPQLSAWQNVAYALRDEPRRQRERTARDWLARLDLEDRADARPNVLSGGERQRVALARALARRPDVLLLDEPLSALDSQTRAAASRHLADALTQTEAPTILVTHDFTQAAQLADHILIVDAGRIVQQGTATELAAKPATAFVADFTGAVVLRGTAQRQPDGTTVVMLSSGEEIRSTDLAVGPVVATVYPWEITIEPAGGSGARSTQNRVQATIHSMTTIGGRVRLALTGPDALVAEVTTTAVAHLSLAPGMAVSATWKATATRLIADR